MANDETNDASGTPKSAQQADDGLKFELDNLTQSAERAPLYEKFDGQSKPQPAYVWLDVDGVVNASASGEIGGGPPANVHHGLVRRWSMPSNINGAALAKMLTTSPVRDLLAAVHAGRAVVWDGNNLVGELTDAAREADEELETLFEALQENTDVLVSVWSADDWLFQSNTLAGVWSGRPLAQTLAQLQAEVNGQTDMQLDGSLEEALLDRAKSAFDREEDQIDEHHVAALLAAGRIQQAEANTWAQDRAQEAAAARERSAG